MVGIVQLVRMPGCGPGGRGFESHRSPHFFCGGTRWGVAKWLRHRILIPAFAGSNPATPATGFYFLYRDDPLAQAVEHLTFNQGVRSSNLRRVTIFIPSLPCGYGEIGRHVGFRFQCPRGRAGSSPVIRTMFHSFS